MQGTQNSAGTTEGYNFLKFLQAGEEYLKTFELIMNILNRYVVSRFYTNQMWTKKSERKKPNVPLDKSAGQITDINSPWKPYPTCTCF